MRAARRNEKIKTWFRSEPVFSCNGKWYFHTREGIDIGPYDSQLEAEIESGMVRQFFRDADGNSFTVLRDFILDSFTMGRPLNVMIATSAEHFVLEQAKAP